MTLFDSSAFVYMHDDRERTLCADVTTAYGAIEVDEYLRTSPLRSIR